MTAKVYPSTFIYGKGSDYPKLPKGWEVNLHPRDFARCHDPDGKRYFLCTDCVIPEKYSAKTGKRCCDLENAIKLEDLK